MSKTQAINPHTGQVIAEYEYFSDEKLDSIIKKSHSAFQTYRKTSLQTRREKLTKLSEILTENAEKYAGIITREQGKPITEAINEVKKAAKHTKYYADNLEKFLKDQVIETEFKKSVIEFHPIGPIFQIVPFNFPLWLVFKSAIPSISIGNTIICKTSSSCPQTGLIVEEAFRLAGFDNGEFQTVLSRQEQSETIIAHPLVRAVSFTGSTRGGTEIAKIAGKYAKKTVMELGGSDAFLVLDDADINLAVETALNSRMRNTGQVCSCSKRFLVHEKVYDQFRDKIVQKVNEIKVGDPMKKETTMGPLTKKKVLDAIDKQVKEGLKQGGKLLLGGKKLEEGEYKNGYYYMPTVVEVQEGNILLHEETFGPIVPLLKVKNTEDMVRIANDTEYGLGATIISQDLEKAQELGKGIDAGSVFFNSPVGSDSRLPSGGVKNSGYGRECGEYGVKEFANIKTVVIK